MAMQFKKAKRSLSKLRLAIQGPSGCGKTYGALLLAKGLGGSIAVIDTERGSASLYSDVEGMPEFDVLDLEAPYTPERYIEAITAAEEAGYDILIIDSMTHEWSGVGGCLEINDMLTRTKYKNNSYAAWNAVTPRHRKFVDKMLASKCHIIATIRSKTDFVQEEQNGKKVVKKVGMKAEQRDGMDYEFTVVFDVTSDDHIATTSKDRTSLFGDPMHLSEQVGQQIAQWLNSAEFESAPRKVDAPVAKPVSKPVEQPVKAQESSIEDLEEDLWEEPKEGTAKLTQIQSIRAEELLEALNSADSPDQVDAIAKSLKALRLPKDCDEYKQLCVAYSQAQKRVL